MQKDSSRSLPQSSKMRSSEEKKQRSSEVGANRAEQALPLPPPPPSHCTAWGDPLLHRPPLPKQVPLKIPWSFLHPYWCQTLNNPHSTLFQLLSHAAGLLSALLRAVQLWLCSSPGGGVSQGRDSFLHAMGTHNRFMICCRGSSHGAMGRAQGTAQSPGQGHVCFSKADHEAPEVFLAQLGGLPYPPFLSPGWDWCLLTACFEGWLCCSVGAARKLCCGKEFSAPTGL